MSEAYIPDQTDWQIIEILAREEATNSAIALSIGVTEGTVRQRLKKLKEAGILKIKALIDPEILENKQLAIVAANVTESRLLEQKAHEIKALPSVLSVSIVSGQYDLLFEVLVDSNKGLVRFLTEELATVKDISKTETFVALKTLDKYV